MIPEFNIIYQDIVTSTNDELKKMAESEKLPEFSVIIANEQTEGRGQRENVWLSDYGKNLIFSFILYPEFLQIQNQFYLSKTVSIGILNYLKLKTDNISIKWPNDIYFQNKKICGILIENSISGNSIKQSIIGIGLNLNQSDFPNNLINAISLYLITGKETELKTELILLMNEIQNTFKILFNNDLELIDTFYFNHMYRFNIDSEFKDSTGIFKGKIVGTLPSGQLIIKKPDSTLITYNFKDVEFL
jgi:BirA family biotin operon repressor/biotin-[acetyl-CoA-carboxylase] ligase